MDGRSEALALLIALCFHQALEGIALGSTMVRAGFSLSKSCIMIVTYAMTTPIGKRCERSDLLLPSIPTCMYCASVTPIGFL